MRISTSVFLTDETIHPVRLAQELEQRGFGGLYLPEHTHIPVSRRSPAPGGGPLPREYGRTLDPLTALSAAAAVTTRLVLGTAVSLVAQHDPIVLAKQVATLDWMSGGRFTLGVGLGWNREEALDHGVQWARRRSQVRDHLALMRALWAAEPTAHQGGFCSVEASEAHPKPVRPGGPRVLLGGAADDRLFADVAEHADGWMPIGGGGLTGTLPRLRRYAPDAEVVPAYVQPSPGKLARLRDLGAAEVILALPAASEPAVLRALDDYSRYL
ncbi:TIGR03619 family F420-dependent LLM class oxidoreductase [Streptomyces durbertensis]|uniref:TIGR03619 family F420-dependent LLM class oxidoreductase n=1 Tax=Streptomyces durbertensis TaxID=2448886 RepID=A0ABR6EM28_9ACTN|nr:TIGR03619 family F420-dependent LLM class oxidoreductase [Streptomyces durbertensis]MBB1246406.1 TIGR03619 family F420-dependent LLM class oxidoreductase [Streptomyces durbertensis]